MADVKAALAKLDNAGIRGASPGAVTAPGLGSVVNASTVCYQAHVQGIGWQSFVCDVDVAGTTGQSRRMEAIKIVVSSDLGNVCYAAHVQGIGWQPPVCDGDIAGTTGQSRRMEAIYIVVSFAQVCYRAHVQNIGWQTAVCDGDIAGTTGQSLRMEAIQIAV